MNIPLTKRPKLDVPGQSPVPEKHARAKKPPFKFVIFFQQLFRRLRHWKTYVPPNAVTYELAVRQFLDNIMGVCSRTLPAWQRIVESGLAEQSPQTDQPIDFLRHHPVEDLYFAGFVALEAAQIPRLYEHGEADIIFSTIADQIDVYAKRGDRLMSDVFFEVIARLNLLHDTVDKRPYDKAVKTILRRLDFDKTDPGKMLLADKGFRHLLAEPFAIYAPHWWEKFKAKFVLYQPEIAEDDEDKEQEAMAELIAKTEAGRKQPKLRWRKRAAALFG
ncbi:MAG: hypothetical protein EXR11_07100 [Rhodospirillaceae bacterium]|nr:hypothetical protein [Rhodospirillaceae bacterium]